MSTLFPYNCAGFFEPMSSMTPGKQSKYVYDDTQPALGSGAFGVAVLAHPFDQPDAKVVVKIVYPQHAPPDMAKEAIEQARKEGRLMRAMGKHFGCIRLIETIERTRTVSSSSDEESKDSKSTGSMTEEVDAVYIVMEYCNAGSLFHLIHQKTRGKDPFSPDEIGFILTQVLLALYSMHRVVKLLHRDLSSGNVLMNTNGIVKVADFGLSKQCEGTVSGDAARTVVGTPAYMAPELMNARSYGAPADVWSFGILSFQLFNCRLPFGQPHDNVLKLQNQVQGFSPSEWDQLINFNRFDFPEDLHVTETVKTMLHRDPAQRPSCAALLRTPFFKHYIPKLRAALETIALPDKAAIIEQLEGVLRHREHSPSHSLRTSSSESSGKNLLVLQEEQEELAKSENENRGRRSPELIFPTERLPTDVDHSIQFEGDVLQRCPDGVRWKKRRMILSNGMIEIVKDKKSISFPVLQVEYCFESVANGDHQFEIHLFDESFLQFRTEGQASLWVNKIDLATGTASAQ